MNNEIISIAMQYLEAEGFGYESIISYIKDIRPIVKIENFYLITSDKDNNFNVKKVNYTDDNIIFPEVHFDDETLGIIYNMSDKEYESVINKYFNHLENPTSKILVLSTTHENLRYIAFIELEGENYQFFKENISIFQFIFSSFILKFIYYIPKNTTSIYSEINFPQVIDEISNTIIICDSGSKRIIYGNKCARKYFGNDFINKKINEVFVPGNITIKAHNIENIDVHFVFNSPKNNFILEVFSQIFSFSDGRQYITFTAFDITENERAKEELKFKSELVELQLKALDEIAIVNIRDMDGKQIYTNSKAKMIFGEDFDDQIENIIANDEKIINTGKSIYDAISKGEIWSGEIKLDTKNIKNFWFHTFVIPLHTESGTKIVSINQDINNIKRQQTEITKLARAIEYSPISIMITDTKGVIEFVNPKFCEITGYIPDEIIGKNPRVLKSGKTSQSEYKLMWDKISNGEVWTGYFHNKKKTGELFIESAIISPIFNETGEIINYIGIKEDVTFKMEIQEALGKSMSLLKTITETTNEGILVFDLSGNKVMFNAKFLLLWDLKEPDIEGLNEIDIINLFENTIINTLEFRNTIEGVSSNNAHINHSLDLINGKTYDISIMPLVQDDKIVGRMWTFRDITEKVENEESLRISNFQLERAKAISDDQARKLEINLKELEIAKDKIEAAANAKSEFIANISHEIRTPLNAVIGFTEIMKEEEISPKQYEYLNSILSSGKNLLRLINDILDMSKIESGRLELINEPVNIERFAKDIYKIFERKINKSKIEFSLKLGSNIPEYIYIDEVRLRQILFNLIGNSVKFTSEGKIEYSFEVINHNTKENTIDLQITVQDTGIGIPKEHQNQVFEAFYQLSTKNTKKYGGTGLGLAITKKLTETIGGTINLVSEPKQGTKFEIIFKNLSIIKSDKINELPKITKTDYENIVFEPASILVADDIYVNITLIKGLLRNQPLNVIAATNGLEAVEVFKNNQFDLALLDYRMPEMNGDEVANIIKNEYKSDIKIILLTASELDNNSYSINENGLFDDSLSKPFKKDKLFELLSKYLKYNIIKKEKVAVVTFDEIDIHNLTLSDEDYENSKKYQSVLIKDFYSEWKEIKNLGIINNVKNFAEKLRDFSNEKNLPTFYYYAVSLLDQAEKFDIEKMNRTIDLFPELIKLHKMEIE